MDNSKRKTFFKADLVIILLVFLLSMVAYFGLKYFGKVENGKAAIYADGVVIKELPLNENTVYKPIGYEMEFTVSEGGICVSDTDCMDKICMHKGYIYGSLETIVCLPNKIVVRIDNNTNSNIDIELN